jgi:hypothetical protein
MQRFVLVVEFQNIISALWQREPYPAAFDNGLMPAERGRTVLRLNGRFGFTSKRVGPSLSNANHDAVSVWSTERWAPASCG